MPPHVPDAQDDSARPSSSGSMRRLGSMGRRRTQPPESGLRKNPSFAKIARQSTETSLLPKGPKPKRNTCSAYDLPWEKLRDFLVGKFPGCTFEITLNEDIYIFDIPESLTIEDHKAIDMLRDNNYNTTNKEVVEERSSQSPEPGET
ncbi:hypothetical protein VE00_02666 [Pseudogymnoascus sp. WSF 3629]|nr:hypothetical protein VE00_02666 [Pseudogymnoascus sp. WSF 3629]